VVNFIKTTVTGGLLFVFPLLVLWLAIREVGVILIAMADPIGHALELLLPAGLLDRLYFRGLIAGILILAVSFIAGLMLRSRILTRLFRSIEAAALKKLPMYTMLKRLSASWIAGEKQSFTPVLYKTADGTLDPCFAIEDHGDGRVTVLMPFAPAAFAGVVRIVSKADLDYLDCSFDELSRSIVNFGTGLHGCIGRNGAGQDASSHRQ
jgi:uncharacterized membrane protein